MYSILFKVQSQLDDSSLTSTILSHPDVLPLRLKISEKAQNETILMLNRNQAFFKEWSFLVLWKHREALKLIVHTKMNISRKRQIDLKQGVHYFLTNH